MTIKIQLNNKEINARISSYFYNRSSNTVLLRGLSRSISIEVINLLRETGCLYVSKLSLFPDLSIDELCFPLSSLDRFECYDQ